ncbi:flagellar filament capping protein FliD [Devosia sp.]|uniref:flagellar filament capping protein FliD n=1 Tax=Devosia sp. TaxID=1871048 RepID=UPI003BAB49AB
MTSSVSSTASLLSSSTSTSSTTSSGSTSSTSDIDWDGLIEEAVQAKLSKADSIDLKITENEAKSAAFQSLSDLLADVQTAAQALRAPSGSSQASTDVFNARTAYLTANGDVDASSSVSATVESGATMGSYDLAITQLATAHKVTSAGQSSKTSDLGYDGVISLGTSTDTMTEIEITSDMTLAEVAEAINAQSDATGVQASVLKVSSSSYQLVLSGTSTGTTIVAEAVSGDDLLTELGITDEAGDFADVLQEPQDAIFSIDGIAVTRTTNDIDDVIEGVTLHLYQVTPDDTSITVEIGTDLSSVKDAIVALVDAYNAYRDFAYAEQQLPSDDNADTTVLFGDSTLRTISAAVTAAISESIGSNTMALLGLSFDSTNNLELDEDTLDDALLSSLDEIQSLLSFQMESSSASLLLLSRGTEVPNDFTLDIVTDSSGVITSALVGGDSSLFTISGTRIIGATGSGYEGFTFVYAGSSSKSVDVSFTTGIAELLYNIADEATDETSGTLTTIISDIGDTNDDLTDKSDDIRSRAETYRTNLTNRYATLQAAISEAESMQDYLTTLLDTWNSSS